MTEGPIKELIITLMGSKKQLKSLQWFYLLCRALVSQGVRLSVCPRREAVGGAEQTERRLPQNSAVCSEHTSGDVLCCCDTTDDDRKR